MVRFVVKRIIGSIVGALGSLLVIIGIFPSMPFKLVLLGIVLMLMGEIAKLEPSPNWKERVKMQLTAWDLAAEQFRYPALWLLLYILFSFKLYLLLALASALISTIKAVFICYRAYLAGGKYASI